MIYLNNAATSYPKPQSVIDKIDESLNALPSGQFRSVGIFGNEDIFPECKKRLAKLLGVEDGDRIFFSSGSTDSLNQIFYGFDLKPEEVITTVTEHNSVLRPLFNISDKAPVLVSCDENGFVEPGDIEARITPEIRAIVLNHCSNVTGTIQDARTIGEIAKKHKLIYILDCSQSAGCIPINADEWNVTALAFTGHKSLLGPQGIGGHYVRAGVELRPMKYGGTGRDSRIISYRDSDHEYEVGTQNAPAIAALNESCRIILEQDVERIHIAESRLMDYFVDQLSQIVNVRIFAKDVKARGPLVSIAIDGLKPSDFAYILQNSYGIITRSGLSCAPLIHKHIGSGEEGTLRLSISQYTTKDDIDETVLAIKEIAMGML